MSDLEATVESKEITISSRKRRMSRRNSVLEQWLPTLFSAVITRIPEKKNPRQMQEIGNDLGSRIPTTAPQVATKKPS